MKIQICKNFSKVNKLQIKLAKAFPDGMITIKSRISMCKICKKQATAKVDEEKFKSKNISKLISKIDKF